MGKRLATLSLLVLAAIVSQTCSGGSTGGASFEDGPGMLYFYSPKCPVCQGMKPIIDQLQKQYGTAYRLVRVNVDTNRGKEQARAHGLIGQPAYLFFDASGEETRRLMGAQPRATLQEVIEQALAAE